MPQLRIVLCPIDFSDLAQQELALAVEVCEAFGAHLVLHHNHAAVSPGFTRAWEWHGVHRADQTSSTTADARMRRILADLPETLSAEASISSGPLGTVLLELARQLPADLVVLGSHGWSTPDHASVTERLIEQCPCPVLTIQEGSGLAQRFRLGVTGGGQPIPVLVPIELSGTGRRVVEYAAGLAGTLPLALHLLHVVPRGSAYLDLDTALRELRDLLPPDLATPAECHVEQGDAIEVILAFSHKVRPGFMVMGEHARGFLRRVFTRDTAREVLHRACCPVWFVPTQG